MSQESSRTCSCAISWSESHAPRSRTRFPIASSTSSSAMSPTRASEVRARDPPRALRRLAGRACGDELLEIRAYHLEQAASLLAELDGAPPAELAKEAAATLQEAGRRALAREANQAARHAFLRAWSSSDARAALPRGEGCLAPDDLPGGRPRDGGRARGGVRVGDQGLEGRALTALADMALMREADPPRARELADQALAVLDRRATRPPASTLPAWAGSVLGRPPDRGRPYLTEQAWLRHAQSGGRISRAPQSSHERARTRRSWSSTRPRRSLRWRASWPRRAARSRAAAGCSSAGRAST